MQPLAASCTGTATDTSQTCDLDASTDGTAECPAGCDHNGVGAIAVGDAVSCGFAPIVAIYADSADWPAPGWYSGELTIDPNMDSPLECQARCEATAACTYFSYEWEITAGASYHECYMKDVL